MERAPAAHVLVADLGAPELEPDDARHLASVLRLRAGESVGVTDGAGGYRLCRWSAGERVEPVGDVERSERTEPGITVGITPVKGDRTEWAVQKLTELGVDRMVLLRAERSVVRWDGRRAEAQLERLQRVARSALMQSRGRWMPSVEGVSDLAALLGGPGVCLAHPGGRPLDLEFPTVLVGPEGGWSEEEVSRAPALIGLGPTVLRAETAAVSAGVLLTALRAGLVSPAGGRR